MPMEHCGAENPITNPPKKKNVNLEMIFQLKEMAKELTGILVLNKKNSLNLMEKVEEMKAELRDVNKQIQI